MRIKNALSALLAMSMMLTSLTLPAVAEETFASASELLGDVLSTSVVGISSKDLSTARSDVETSITVNGDEVLYKGSSLGYWYSDTPSTLYKDSSKSSTVVKAVTDGYEVSSNLLYKLLDDVNEGLVENYVPTTEDWSKIVGKYDISLGDITIPADQWIPVSTRTANDALTGDNSINLSSISGIDGGTIGKIWTSTNYIGAFSWGLDNSGNLWVQPTIVFIGLNSSNTKIWGTGYSSASGASLTSSLNGVTVSDANLLKASIIDKGATMCACLTAQNAVGTSNGSYFTNDAVTSNDRLTKVIDPSLKYANLTTQLKQTGIAYVTGEQIGSTTVQSQVTDIVKHMFDSYSCGKLVRGNTKLTKRLCKIATLSNSDVLTVKNSGWYVNDGTSIDNYMGVQQMANAGDTADINAVAEVEPLNFNVVVPTTLPVYVDSEGITTVASNATITNKSNSSVKLTDINIVPKTESGWTLVGSDPSPVRDSKEYTFTTSLIKDTILVKSEELPFTYTAQLSPLTEGADSLDLATVAVTVDWAD